MILGKVCPVVMADDDDGILPENGGFSAVIRDVLRLLFSM